MCFLACDRGVCKQLRLKVAVVPLPLCCRKVISHQGATLGSASLCSRCVCFLCFCVFVALAPAEATVSESSNTCPAHKSFEAVPLSLHCFITSSLFFPCHSLIFLFFRFFFSTATLLSAVFFYPQISLVLGQTTDTGTLSFTVPLGSASNWQRGVEGLEFRVATSSKHGLLSQQ